MGAGRTNILTGAMEMISITNNAHRGFPSIHPRENGLLLKSDDLLMYCGGSNQINALVEECFCYSAVEELTLWMRGPALDYPKRYFYGVLVEPHESKGPPFFWIGGGETSNGRLLSSTFQLTLASAHNCNELTWKQSHGLPIKIAGHCMVQLTKTQTLLAGGFIESAEQLERDSFVFDWEDESKGKVIPRQINVAN